MAVALWHAGLVHPRVTPANPIFSLFQQGHTGVALFCVLSGFIFARMYFEKEFEFGKFAVHRVLRIWPLLIVVALITIWKTPDADLSSIFITLTTTVPVPGGLPKYLAVAWSVLVEIQFYVFFPFLLLISKRFGPLCLVLVAGSFLAIRAYHYAHYGEVSGFSYGTIVGRMDQFALGMIAGILSLKDNPFTKKAFMCLGACGLVAIFSFYAWFNTHLGGYYGPATARASVWVVVPTIEALCYSAIVLGYLSLPPIGGHAKYVDKAFAYGGQISYSIYLVHLMILPTFRQIVGQLHIEVTTWEQQAVLFMIIGVPLIVFFSSLSYFLIEKPMNDLKYKISAGWFRPAPQLRGSSIEDRADQPIKLSA